MSELGYPDGIYQYFFNICFLHPINICAGFYYKNPIGGTMGLALFGTSLNYWRYPLITSYRRKMDIVVAFVSVSYHIYLSLLTKTNYYAQVLYYVVVLCILSVYGYKNVIMLNMLRFAIVYCTSL